MTQHSEEIAAEEAQASILKIQAGKGLRPFFFLHGDWWSKAPIYCYSIARALGRARPFYSVPTYNFEGPNKPLTLEALATEHIKAIKSVQPEGPYLLGGYCNGALIACEVVRQLQEQGEDVKILVLITPSTLPSTPKKLFRAIRSICSVLHISLKLQRNLFLRVRHARRHLLRYIEPANNSRFTDYRYLVEMEPRFAKMFPPIDVLYKEYAGYYIWLAGTYQIRFDPKPVRFIWVEEDLDKRPRWQHLEQEDAPITIMPGTHLSCVTEQASEVAEHVKAYVEQAEETEVSL